MNADFYDLVTACSVFREQAVAFDAEFSPVMRARGDGNLQHTVHGLDGDFRTQHGLGDIYGDTAVDGVAFTPEFFRILDVNIKDEVARRSALDARPAPAGTYQLLPLFAAGGDWDEEHDFESEKPP